MKKFRNVISIFICLIIFFSILSINSNAKTQGTCGEYGHDVFWNFDTDTGTLTISGNGEMKNHVDSYTWDNNFKDIVNIVIEENVTSIGEYSFSYCEKLNRISIPKSVLSVGENAFLGCNSLSVISYAGTAEDWEKIDICNKGNDSVFSAEIEYSDELHKCSFDNLISHIEPTCVNAGLNVYECSCGEKYTESISATGIHSYVWIVSKEATCTTPGEETLRCNICKSEKETRTIEALGHMETEWVVIDEATCKSEGKQVKKCSVCDVVLKEKMLDKLPHNFGEWKVSVVPTVEEYGIDTRTCKSCKLVETRQTDKLPNTSADNYLIGDANGDKEIRATDARMVLQVVAGLKSYDDIIFVNADVNDDKNITATDARIILQIVAGIYNS